MGKTTFSLRIWMELLGFFSQRNDGSDGRPWYGGSTVS